jgi:hypothetical protein
MAEIVVERGTKDQRVFQPFAWLILAGVHLNLTTSGLHAARADASPRLRLALSMARISLCGPGAEVAIRSSEPTGILPWATRSFSTYLFFINTKTR